MQRAPRRQKQRAWLTRSPQPFNAFLAGFSITVGQFVLTASLRMQTNPENRSEFASVSDERYVSVCIPPDRCAERS